MGVAAAAAALAAAPDHVLVRFLRLPRMIDLLRRDESSVDAFGRNAKGGIENFPEPVRHLPGELVGLGVRHERPPPDDRQPSRDDLLRQQHRVGMQVTVAHRHLGQHDDHRQAHLVEPADEIRLGLLETPVHATDAVPRDVNLL